MASVRILDKSVAERIAAGEIIERPASVVKELVENSLDAGATHITVDLQGGGAAAIEVVDNGAGMTAEDAGLAVQRFATSKIQALEDLERLDSYGFRGEALPSIAAVSRFDLLTKPTGALEGTRITIEGGGAVRTEAAGAPEGTRIRVEELFFNTPARRKFLKSPRAETAQVVEAVGRLALVRDGVSLTIASGGKTLLDLPGALDLPARVAKVLNLQAQADLIPIEGSAEGMTVRGYVGRPHISRSTRQHQALFVNGRLIRSPLISQALVEGFEPLLPPRRFPVGIVIIELDGRQVDVNVHPTKAEVRFARSQDVFRLVSAAVRASLAGAGFTLEPMGETVTLTMGPRAELQASLSGLEGAPPRGHFTPAWRSGGGTGEGAAPPAGSAGRLGEQLTPYAVPLGAATMDAAGVVRPLAQIRNTYLICTDGRDLILVDQHTAHERMNFEALLAKPRGEAQSQGLLVPIVVEVSPQEAALLGDHIPLFAHIGMDIEPFGQGTFLVRSVPPGLSRLGRKDAIQDLLGEFGRSGRAKTAEEAREHLLATAACKAAVKAGDPLAPEEMAGLVASVLALERGAYCPHGRPAVIRLNGEAMDRLFGRA